MAKTKGITELSSMKWNDYSNECETDSLFLSNINRSKLVIISPGYDDDEGQDILNIIVYEDYRDDDFEGTREGGGGILFMDTDIYNSNPTLQEIIDEISSRTDELDEMDDIANLCLLHPSDEGNRLCESMEDKIQSTMAHILQKFTQPEVFPVRN